MAVPPGTIPRGPDRFIDDIPTAYRFFQSTEAEGGVSGQVANLVTDAEFHLQEYWDKQPMLIIGGDEFPNAPLADMSRGLQMFEMVNGRASFLKLFYFTGSDMVPVESGLSTDQRTFSAVSRSGGQKTSTGGWLSRVFRRLFRR